MAMTLRTVEATPAARPAVTGLSPAAAAVPAEVIWRRLEGWCGHRWGVRSATMMVQGGGVWEPRLRPWSLVQAERWAFGDWEPFTPAAHPLGFDLDGCGDDPVRFTLEVGEATAGADVLEAFRRLAEYHAQASVEVAAGMAAHTSGSDGDYQWQRSAAWVAKALHLSGAADLLRPYRYLGAC